MSEEPAEEYDVEDFRITSENKENIIYDNIDKTDLDKEWKSAKVQTAKDRLRLFTKIDKMLENKTIEPAYLVALLSEENFNDPDSTKKSTVIAGALAANGSRQIEQALLEMLSIEDYHTKIQAVLALADTKFTSEQTVEKLQYLLNEDDELGQVALLSLSTLANKSESGDTLDTARDAIKLFIERESDEKLIMDAIGNSGDEYFLEYLNSKLKVSDPLTQSTAIYQLRKMDSMRVNSMIQEINRYR